MLPFIDLPFVSIARITGASIDELKLISSFLLSYPLAAVLKRIPDSKKWQKDLFIIGVSLFYMVGLFDLWAGVRTISISSAAAYALAYYVDGSLMPWIAFVFLMGHMSFSHIYRQIADSPSTIDITGAQMVLVMKLTAFCWNVHDGRLPENELAEWQKESALKELPDLLDFASYVLFFPSFFVGPSFDYVHFHRYIETTMFDLPPGVDPSKAPPTRKKRKVPRSGKPATRKAVIGLVWIAVYLKFGGWYTTELLLSDRYMEYSLLRRIWILVMYAFTARQKYYAVWSLTEGACILSGMGYAGVDAKTGKVRWDRLENVNPWSLETAQNSRAFLGNWNKNTNNWLRNYMYLRVTPRGKKPGFRASLATFTTSAFWHGFYPGYYLAFVLAAFLQTVAKNFRRHVRPFFLTPDGASPTARKPYYDLLSWLTTQIAFSFCAAPFVILRFRPCILVWGRVYFYDIIGVIACLSFFSTCKPWLIRKLKQQNQHLGQRQRPPVTAAATTPIKPDEEPRLKLELEPEQLVPTGEGTVATAAAADDDETAGLGLGMGLPDDPAGEIDDALREIRQEVELRRRKGSLVTMPKGGDLKAAVENKLGKKL